MFSVIRRIFAGQKESAELGWNMGRMVCAGKECEEEFQIVQLFSGGQPIKGPYIAFQKKHHVCTLREYTYVLCERCNIQREQGTLPLKMLSPPSVIDYSEELEVGEWSFPNFAYAPTL